jgi:hypothetical protein
MIARLKPSNADNYLLGAAAKQLGDAFSSGARGHHAAGANRAIGVPGIDDHRAHRSRGSAHVFARKDDRRRLHQILREDGGGRRWRIGDDQRDIAHSRVAAFF